MLSKTNLFIGATIFLLIAVSAYFAWEWNRDRTISVTVTERVDRPALSFSFAFPSGPDALSFFESAPAEQDDVALQNVILLAETKTFQNPEDNADRGTISIFVFDWTEAMSDTTAGLDSRSKLATWAAAHPGYSTVTETTEFTPTEIDGAPAITYTSRGELAREIFLSRYDKKVYLFVSQYQAPGDTIDTAFDTVIGSVLFE